MLCFIEYFTGKDVSCWGVILLGNSGFKLQPLTMRELVFAKTESEPRASRECIRSDKRLEAIATMKHAYRDFTRWPEPSETKQRWGISVS